MPFKPGDVVQLKSGGPKMTVDKENIDPIRALDADGVKIYDCTWFDRAKLCHGSFPDTHLMMPDSPGKSFSSSASGRSVRR